MVMRRAVVVAWTLTITSASAQDARFYGQSGTEGAVSNANPSSPLNPGGILNIPRLTDTSYLTLFGDVTSGDKRWKLEMKLRGSNDRSGDSSYKFDVSEPSLRYAAAS